jgi:uncharacterized membrane protein YjjB (DUF3815 family)
MSFATVPYLRRGWCSFCLDSLSVRAFASYEIHFCEVTTLNSSVQGSLELASKNFITGATKIVYAIIYSLILVSVFVERITMIFDEKKYAQGFSLTLGSDIAFLINSSFREQRDQMAADITRTISLIGTYTAINATDLISPLNGAFILDQLVLPDEPLVEYHYIMEGCYRDPSWSTVFQPFAWPWLFAFAPLFVLCLATLNGQGWRDWRRLLVIVVFGCCSFAANKVFNMWIYDRGDVVSAIGATVVGILGTVYGHYSEGDALPSMIPGILVLLPVKFKYVYSVRAKLNQDFSYFYRPGCPWLAASVPTFTIQPVRSQVGLALGSRWFKARRVLFPSVIRSASCFWLGSPHPPISHSVTIGITVGLFASNLAIATFISATRKLKGTPPRKTQVGSAF